MCPSGRGGDDVDGGSGGGGSVVMVMGQLGIHINQKDKD